MSDEYWYPYRISIPEQDVLEDVYRCLLEEGYNVTAIRSPSDKRYYLYVVNEEDINAIARILEDDDVDYEIHEWDMEPE